MLSQTAPLVAGSTILFSYVQNVGRTHALGAELAFEQRDLLRGLDVSGSATLADPKISSDPAFRAAEGKLIPQVPRRRATYFLFHPFPGRTFTAEFHWHL